MFLVLSIPFDVTGLLSKKSLNFMREMTSTEMYEI